MKKHTTNNVLLNSEKELNQYLLDSFGTSLKQAIKSTVQIMVRAEMETLRQQLDERPVFNGSYGRHLISPVGKIEDIPIARFRTGNKELSLSSLKVFDEEKGRFYNLVAEMHAAGISQRKIDTLCKHSFGKAVPAQTTKRVFGELLEQEAFQVNKQQLSGATFDYLYADGLWHTVIGTLTGEGKEQVVLAVSGYSVARNEHRFLGFLLAEAEDEESWTRLLLDLKKRGLDMATVKLLAADGGGGLLAAVERLAPDLAVQLCLAHRYRNVLKHTGSQHKKEMGRDLKTLTAAASKESFMERAQDVEKKWHVLEPRAMKSLTWKLALSTAYFAFPQEDWKHIRTTNKLERAFREIRRRTAIQNHHFQSNESATNYMNAAMMYAHRT